MNGNFVTIRLSNHNAKVSNFDNNGEFYGISIVISRKPNKGITNDGDAHIVEYYYSDKKLTKAEGKPLADIIGSLKQALYSGEFTDTTGLAERQEVNLNNPEFHIVYHGSSAKFDAFDHSHMGEGEGAQAYGWGTYVTEVEGIGKSYANIGLRRGSHITYDGVPFWEVLDNEYYFDETWRIWKRYLFEAETTEDLKKRINSVYIDGRVASPRSKRRKEFDRQKKELLADIDNGRIKVDAPRHLYTVEIPDDTGSNYLSWDAQVKPEQAERINAGLQEIEETLNGYESSDARLMYKRSGVQIYNALQVALGSDKAASEFLARNGFVGIKYPAQYRSGGRADGASNYVIFNETDAKIVNRVEFLRTPQGTVYGWTDGNKIYLTKDGINPETPIHEYTHIWAKAMMQNNPNGWNSIKDLLRETPIWNEVINDPNYADIRNDENAVTSEALSRMSGKENARRMEQEAQRLIDEAQGETAKADATNLIQRMRKALNEFWNWVATDLFHIKEFDSVEQITDRVLWDMLNGTELNATPDGRTEKQIIGEQGAKALDKANEATHRMDNLAVAREMEDAFNAKRMRIEKLRASKPIMVEFNGEYELNRTSAKQWAKDNLRGEYINADIGEKIGLSKVGINEVTSHGSQDEAHLISIKAIPAFIEQSIFIDEIPNTKSHDKYDSYRYYVCGAKINEEDYTVKIVVGVKGDSKYYDHRLTQIEKGSLIDNLNGLSNSVAEHQKASLIGKDNKLASLLQTNEKENAKRIRMATGWERGADGKWRYEIEDSKISDTIEIDGKKFKRDGYEMLWRSGKLIDHVDNPALFEAYPELANIRIETDDMTGDNVSNGGYDAKLKRIVIHASDVKELNSILNHEIQHAIQHIEGFAKGGNEKTALIYGAEHPYHEAILTAKYVVENAKRKGYDLDYNKVKELMLAIDNDTATPEMEAELIKGTGLTIEELGDLYPFDLTFKMYQSFAGEVEARNAQSRMNMTPEQRRETLLAETEDVAREDQIFLMENTNLRSLNKNNDQNELSLQKINSNDVSKRISQEDNRSLSEEDGRMAEIANRLQERSRAYEESNGRSGQTISEYERKEIELKEAETYAKENGLWLDMSDAMRLGEPGPSGNENDTYVAYDNTIYKINNLINSKGIVQLLNKILLHNRYFPQTSYKLVGFTGFDGRNVYPILKQQYVKNATFATPEEIDSYMRGPGFEQVGEASYSNEKITISDLRPRNVMKDTDGDIYVIDAEFNINNSNKETDLLREQGIEFLESNSNLQQLTPEDATNHTIALEQRAQEVANKLGVEVEIDNNLRAKGAYNTRTGRIRINPSRCVTEQDVEKTILHEALGHGGIQAVTGARFNDVCRMAYDLMSEEQRADFRRRHGNIDDEAI